MFSYIDIIIYVHTKRLNVCPWFIKQSRSPESICIFWSKLTKYVEQKYSDVWIFIYVTK